MSHDRNVIACAPTYWNMPRKTSASVVLRSLALQQLNVKILRSGFSQNRKASLQWEVTARNPVLATCRP